MIMTYGHYGDVMLHADSTTDFTADMTRFDMFDPAPAGIDDFTLMMQNLEQELLPSAFGVDESLCLFFGRGEIVTLKDEPVKVIFTSGKDYKALEYDGKFAFKSYLMVNGIEWRGLLERVNVSLYCHGDLTKLFPSISHRADGEMRAVMNAFVKRLVEPQNLISTEIIEEMQPYHSFKINFVIT